MSTAYAALSLPLRREILDQLRAGPATVGDLAEALGVPQAVASKQLGILREAGFVQARADAQRRWYALLPEAFTEVAQWLEPYRWLWEDRLDRLGDRLDQMQEHDQMQEEEQS
ncbi:helix-turn-helix transcriptional regulator [Brachybacterium sp. FME24]|uniref:ArsR/SmtB family transcription factor n=1 Tax=Brachybacterium sp. FME24 TaxID=2742605 RepID=UPI001867D24B|nr:metalloregulator ArsR/SmtB family transcription factor [Brachybacterium sp. FME24]